MGKGWASVWRDKDTRWFVFHFLLLLSLLTHSIKIPAPAVLLSTRFHLKQNDRMLENRKVDGWSPLSIRGKNRINFHFALWEFSSYINFHSQKTKKEKRAQKKMLNEKNSWYDFPLIRKKSSHLTSFFLRAAWEIYHGNMNEEHLWNGLVINFKIEQWLEYEWRSFKIRHNFKKYSGFLLEIECFVSISIFLLQNVGVFVVWDYVCWWFSCVNRNLIFSYFIHFVRWIWKPEKSKAFIHLSIDHNLFRKWSITVLKLILLISASRYQNIVQPVFR